jgi:hypothetical protein
VSDDESARRDIGYDADPQLAVERALQQRPRTREHSDAAVVERVGKWSPSKVVTTARCRVKNKLGEQCPNLVSVTQDGLDAIETFSRLLEARGRTAIGRNVAEEKPLDLNECFPCESCLAARGTREAERNKARNERTRMAIRQLKGDEACSQDDEREATLFLERTLGPAYLRDLQTAIAERDANKPARRRGRAGDL